MTTGSNELALERLPGRYAVCRLDSHESIPAWASVAAPFGTQAAAEGSVAAGRPSSIVPLLSFTRTDRELSIVIDETRVPPDVRAERGFIALRVKGTLEFSLVGVLAKLTGALAAANVPVFVTSTFETDVLLVRADQRGAAMAALQEIAKFAD